MYIIINRYKNFVTIIACILTYRYIVLIVRFGSMIASRAPTK